MGWIVVGAVQLIVRTHSTLPAPLGKAREYYEKALTLTAPPRRIDERVGKRVRGKLLKACKGTTPSILFKRWDQG